MIAVDTRRVPFTEGRTAPLIHGAIYLYCFFLPLENWDLLGTEGAFTFTRLIGLLCGCLALTDFKHCFGHRPKAFWLLSAYFVISCVISWATFGVDLFIISTLWSLLQNVVMFLIMYNIMQNELYALKILFAIILGGSVLVIIALVDSHFFDVLESERITALSMNTNVFAFQNALVAIGVLGLTIIVRRSLVTAVLVALSLVVVYEVVRSGSRGGMLSLGLGVVLLFFGQENQKGRSKFLIFIIAAIVLVMGIRMIMMSDLIRSRWEATVTMGEIAGRDVIFRENLNMIQEKPLFGWGPGTHLVELATRCGYEGIFRDPHNDIMWALGSTGLAGAIPFVIGVGLCVRGARRGRKSVQGAIPLALAVVVVMMSMSMTVQNRKIAWMVLAYCAASEAWASEAWNRDRRFQFGRYPKR
jgi:O-antigen ligase